MQIPPKRGRVLRCHHRSRISKNGSSESRGNCALANASNSKRCEKLSRLLQLLPCLYSPLLKHGTTSEQPHKEESEMGMDGHQRTSLPKAEANMCFIPSAMNPRLATSIHLRNRCLWICTRSRHYAGV